MSRGPDKKERRHRPSSYWITDGAQNKQLPIDVPLPNGWRYGRFGISFGRRWITDGYKNKRLHDDDPVPDGWHLGLSKESRWATNGDLNRQLKPDEPLPDGWRYGLTRNIRDLRWITDGKLNKQIDADGSLPEGWQYGMTRAPKYHVYYKVFRSHRKNARKAGIEFLLSFNEWLEIWESSGHLDERGCRRGQYVMARFGDKGPYAVGNVRIATVAENLAEAWTNEDIQARMRRGLSTRWHRGLTRKQKAAR